MQTITLKDKEFSLSITSEEIQKVVARLAGQINTDLAGTRPIFLVILNGSFMFAADLLKKIELECEITFVKLASYSGTKSTERIKKLIGINEDLKGRTVVILEDIIDSGFTMEDMLDQLKELEPAMVKIVTFLFKPEAFSRHYKIDYIGLSIPNDFIVGYGLDYDGLGRNLPDIYKIVGW
jgi:hypoxanthine phosphoribosyltransferase